MITSEHHEVAALLHAFGPWSSSQLAAALQITPSRAGILAARLADRGWAVRHSGKTWALTERGEAMLDTWNIEAIVERAEADRGW